MDRDGYEALAQLDREADELSATVLALDLRLKAAAHDPLLDDTAFLALCDSAAATRRHLWQTWHRIRALHEDAH